MTTDPRQELLACAADPQGDVAEGALWMASEDCDSVDVDGCLDRIEGLAQILRGQLPGHRPEQVLASLQDLFRDQLNLRGCGGGDPRAHYLHQVLSRGLGVPLACASLWIAVGRRAGVDIEGVALPGHFVVRVGGVMADAFTGGEILDEAAVRRIIGDALDTEPDHLDPVWLMRATTRLILARMSRNLRGCYVARERWELALRAADRCVVLMPERPAELRDRGLLNWRAGQVPAAMQDLRAYLDADPGASDRDKVEDMLQRLRAEMN